MTPETRVFGTLFIIAFLTVLIRMVRRNSLRAKYTFLWLIIGLTCLALVAIPGLLDWSSEVVGVFYPPTLLLGAAIMLLLFVSLHFSWELSRLEERTRALAEELALVSSSLDDARYSKPTELGS